MGRLFTVQEDNFEVPAVVKTANFTGTVNLSTKTARAVEFWVDITAYSGFTSVDFVFDTAMDDPAVAADFSEQIRISGVTATGVQTAVLNRADQALGKVVRYRLIVNGSGSITYKIRMGRME